MDANLFVDGQPIDTQDRFIEGSLSYLRKSVAIIYIICGQSECKYYKTSYF